jgi:hypothetical protein
LPRTGSILDIGCGSGEPIARYLIEAGYDLTGADSSPAMIEMCKSRFPNQNWLIEDMRILSLARRFEGLLAWDSFFHLRKDDQRKMFPIFRAHAAPNAALMFTSGPRDGEAMGTYRGEPLYHASLAAPSTGRCSMKMASMLCRIWPRTRHAAAARFGWRKADKPSRRMAKTKIGPRLAALLRCVPWPRCVSLATA